MIVYKTVIGDYEKFDDAVNLALEEEGVELYGNPYIMPINPSGECWFCQALTKNPKEGE